MSDYQPIPVKEAKRLAELYGKSIVIVMAHDPVHGLMHTTTYGVDPQNKAWAAQGGEIACKALGGLLDESTQFEDYRLLQAQKLLTTLKSAVALADEAYREWDNDHDFRVGKILRYFGDPSLRGYRPDIDAIHDAITEAEKVIPSVEVAAQ